MLFIFGGVVWAFTSLTLVETCVPPPQPSQSRLAPERSTSDSSGAHRYAPTLLKWRAQKLRKETGDESIMTEQERQGRPLAEIAHETLLRPLVMLATKPVMLCMSGYLCLVYGLLYACVGVPFPAALLTGT